MLMLGRNKHNTVKQVSQFSSVTQSCLTLCNPMDCSTLGFPVLHYLFKLAQTHVHWVSDAIQSSHPLLVPLLLPSTFPSIRVFSSELTLHIRWPKYWSFSISISPSNDNLLNFTYSSIWPLLHLQPKSWKTWSFYRLHRFTFSRMPCSWNHTWSLSDWILPLSNM